MSENPSLLREINSFHHHVASRYPREQEPQYVLSGVLHGGRTLGKQGLRQRHKASSQKKWDKARARGNRIERMIGNEKENTTHSMKVIKTPIEPASAVGWVPAEGARAMEFPCGSPDLLSIRLLFAHWRRSLACMDRMSWLSGWLSSGCLIISSWIQPVGGTRGRGKSRRKMRSEILPPCSPPLEITAPIRQPSLYSHALRFCSLPLPCALPGLG